MSCCILYVDGAYKNHINIISVFIGVGQDKCLKLFIYLLFCRRAAFNIKAESAGAVSYPEPAGLTAIALAYAYFFIEP